MRLIVKFGGMSVGSKERISAAADYIKQIHKKDGHQVLVVTSAMAKTTDKLVNFTTSMIKQIDDIRVIKESMLFAKQLEHSHMDVATSLLQDQTLISEIRMILAVECRRLEKMLIGIHLVGEATAQSLDVIYSTGERLSTPLLSYRLKQLGLNSIPVKGEDSGITTDNNFGNATPNMELTREKVKEKLIPLWKPDVIPVVNGYTGSSLQGRISTLGRGGSDYSASILGNALDVDEIWIMTHVDGIQTSDPSLVKDALTLSQLSYAEGSDLAYFGAKVLHPKMLLPATAKMIPIRVKNALRPELPGTLIVKDLPKGIRVVRALTKKEEISIVHIHHPGIDVNTRVMAEVFNILAENSIQILMMVRGSSASSFTLVVHNTQVQDVKTALEKLESSSITIEPLSELAVLAVVGTGIGLNCDVLAKIMALFAKNNLETYMITHSCFESNIAFMVASNRIDEAIQLLHGEFALSHADEGGSTK